MSLKTAFVSLFMIVLACGTVQAMEQTVQGVEQTVQGGDLEGNAGLSEKEEQEKTEQRDTEDETLKKWEKEIEEQKEKELSEEQPHYKNVNTEDDIDKSFI